MPSRNWQLRLRDILAAIGSIQRQTAEMSFEEFSQNETLVKAVLYDFVVIGEAAIAIPPELREQYSSIPWRLMGDMRNVIAHEYFQVELRTVWNTAQNNLPPLVVQLEAILGSEGTEA